MEMNTYDLKVLISAGYLDYTVEPGYTEQKRLIWQWGAI